MGPVAWGNPSRYVDDVTNQLPIGGSHIVSMAAVLEEIGENFDGTGTALVGGTTDNGPYWTSAWGVSDAPVTSADLSGGAVNVTDAPTAGQKLCIDDILISCDESVRVIFTCETTNAVIAHVRVPADGTAQITFRGKRKLATADKKLKAQTNAAGNIEILVGYHSEA